MTRRRFTPPAAPWAMCPALTPTRAAGKTAVRAGGSPALQGTPRQRTGEPFAQRTLWRARGARRGQGEVPFDVRFGGPDRHRALRAAGLKPARPTAGEGRP